MKFVDDFAYGIGFDPDSLKTGIVLFGNVPLCLVYNQLPNRVSKDVFSILVSSLLFTVLFDPSGLLQLIVLSFVCYALSGRCKNYRWGPVLVFFVSMGTLAAK